MNPLKSITDRLQGRSVSLDCPECPTSIEAGGVSRKEEEKLRDHMDKHVTTHLKRL